MEALGERRRESRESKPGNGLIQIGVSAPGGGLQVLRGKLSDVNSLGLGLETVAPLEVGSRIMLWGTSLAPPADSDKRFALVVYCRLHNGKFYRAGCSYEEAETANSSSHDRVSQTDTGKSSFVDFYEVLQVSPSADFDTVQRVYRMLAQRYHPDNPETGNREAFQLVLRAYQILSDPEKRAAYDVEHESRRALRWKIFDQTRSLRGVEAEKKKRRGILSVLYSQRQQQPEKPGLMIRDLEDLLGCPREHLQFSLWYLRDNQLITAGDQGRFSITVKGVDLVEQDGLWRKETAPLLLGKAQPEARSPTGEADKI